ncbi:hypothetical protein [Rickettsia hoogstraalii]|uniref:hypothetical protein n=1 Tax=Rickettsia hoogstraalii TaxID=467174 RepID=UPI000AA4CDF5|nr:hypothetical protein [Rickettsia hoogstraalii]
MRGELHSNSTKQSQEYLTRLPRRFAPRNDGDGLGIPFYTKINKVLRFSLKS